MEHEHGVAAREGALGEAPRHVLHDDGGGGGGVVDEGDLGGAGRPDGGGDGGARAGEPRLEGVEVERVGLREEQALPPRARREDRGRAAAEGAVVDAGHGAVVVRELGADLGLRDRRARALRHGGVHVVGRRLTAVRSRGHRVFGG